MPLKCVKSRPVAPARSTNHSDKGPDETVPALLVAPPSDEPPHAGVQAISTIAASALRNVTVEPFPPVLPFPPVPFALSEVEGPFLPWAWPFGQPRSIAAPMSRACRHPRARPPERRSTTSSSVGPRTV